MMAQGYESLPPGWEIQIEFQDPGYGLTASGIWGMNHVMEKSLCVSVCISLSLK